jgi:hypothetical protein
METPAQSVQRNEFEIKAEEQIEKLVGEIGQVIHSADAARRAELKELAETLLHQETVSISEEAQTAETAPLRKRSNPLAAGILLTLFGLGLAIIVPFIGLTMTGIGLILVLWGAVMSWSRS